MSNTLAPTITAWLVTDEATARAIADQVSEHYDPDDLAASAFEIPDADALPTSVRRPGREGAMGTLMADDDLPWRAELYFGSPPDEDDIRAFIREIAGEAAANTLAFEEIAATDWVAAALEGLDPVEAGRFLVYGAHDRAAVKPHRIGIEIEAALAFGTGHHGTTRGCLLHFDALLKRRRPRHIADIGSGTGVLAIGAAKSLKQRIHAGEIDPDSVRIAIGNARLNGVSPFLRPVIAAGLNHGSLRAIRRYDLVFANILARPLRKLAPEIARATADHGELILSGLLARDVPGVLSAYGAEGFCLVRKMVLEGWSSLVLRRGGSAPRKR